MLNEAKLQTKQRKALEDNQFGLPKLRAYPLNDKTHTLQAIRMFNYVDSKYEKELATNLIKAINKHKMDVAVGENNRFYKYYMKDKKPISNKVKAVYEELKRSRYFK